jgi:hypothetical protein
MVLCCPAEDLKEVSVLSKELLRVGMASARDLNMATELLSAIVRGREEYIKQGYLDLEMPEHFNVKACKILEDLLGPEWKVDLKSCGEHIRVF